MFSDKAFVVVKHSRQYVTLQIKQKLFLLNLARLYIALRCDSNVNMPLSG